MKGMSVYMYYICVNVHGCIYPGGCVHVYVSACV